MTDKKIEANKANPVLNIEEIEDTCFERRLLCRNMLTLEKASDDNSDFHARLSKVNESLAVLNPKDAQQLMLCAQMTTLHEAQQKIGSYLAAVADKPHLMSSYVNALTKLSNAFNQQLVSLSKLQGKNQQKVRVEHVTVHAGAQAVVGTVENHNHGGSKKDE